MGQKLWRQGLYNNALFIILYAAQKILDKSSGIWYYIMGIADYYIYKRLPDLIVLACAYPRYRSSTLYRTFGPGQKAVISRKYCIFFAEIFHNMKRI